MATHTHQSLHYSTFQPTQSPTTSAPTGLCEANPVELYDGSSLSGVTVIDTEDISGYRAWEVDDRGGCTAAGIFDNTPGSENQFTAGLQTGVDRRTTLSIPVPAGATSVQYYYSYTGFEGRNDDFIVGFDCNYATNSACNGGTVAIEYGETGGDDLEVICAQECLAIPANTTTLDILCKTRRNNEQCSIDQIQFFDTSGRRRKLSGSDPSDALQSLSHPPPPPPVTIASDTTRARQSVSPTPQTTWNRFTYNKKKFNKKNTEPSQAGQNIVQKPSTTKTTARQKPQEPPPEEVEVTFESIFAKLTAEEEMTCNSKTARHGLRDNCSSNNEEEEHLTCCQDGQTKEFGCGTCKSCVGRGEILNGRDAYGSTCCHNSMLAEDPSVRCFEPESGRVNYDHCCKSTNQLGTNQPDDFYCFRDKGSTIGNYAYCLTIADNPPHTYTRKPPPKQPKKLRSQYAKRMKNRDDKCGVMLIISMICMSALMLWKKSIKAARLNSDNRNDDEEEEEDFPVLII